MDDLGAALLAAEQRVRVLIDRQLAAAVPNDHDRRRWGRRVCLVRRPAAVSVIKAKPEGTPLLGVE